MKNNRRPINHSLIFCIGFAFQIASYFTEGAASDSFAWATIAVYSGGIAALVLHRFQTNEH